MLPDTGKRRRKLAAHEAGQQMAARLDEVRDRAATLVLNAPQLTGFEDEHTRDLIRANQYMRRGGMVSLRPLLPLMLRLKGSPYSLKDHFPFEPFFRTRIPRQIQLKTGRQVAKSTGLAARGIIFSNSIPFFSTLFVTPLFEMIRRFSHQYVRQFIEESPVKRLFMESKTLNSVLQRTFSNGSSMYFSYAFLDAERTRGIPADANIIDEVQDMAYDHIPIIHQTLGASKWRLIQYAGTPKSLDNTIEALWQDSSQAEFMIKCHAAGCGYWNVPALTHDLDDMIGRWHRGIGPDCAGIICAECAKPLDPRRHGRWVHGVQDRRWKFPGYHIPQIIMPMHYGNHETWDTLVGKQAGRGNTSRTVFLNEVCGESCDSGSKLVTLSDLKLAACLPWKNDWRISSKRYRDYIKRVLAVDWGGGGGRVGNSAKDDDKRLRTSYTSLAALGYRPDGKIDVIWGHRSLRTHDYAYEAMLVADALKRFRCSHVVHDYGGAGAPREHILAYAGLPLGSIIPIRYVPTARQGLMTFHPATEAHPRDIYQLDKARSLVTTCECIKYGLIRFFQYDYVSSEDTGLLRDFLALQEEKIDSRAATDSFVVVRNPHMPDDFAHAVNMGCCALWYMHKAWPDVAAAARFTLDPELLARLHPTTKIDWDDIR